MKKITLSMVAICLMFALLPIINVGKTYAENFNENCKASLLIDKSTGKTLYANNENERLPVASVVKLMSILITLEEMNSGKLTVDDKIVVSENASHMGGSQIFLDANTEYSAGELLKSVIVASANDSTVALAEHIAGSEDLFVKRMNEKCAEMNLSNTNYVNCTGLPAVNQYSCCKDVSKILSKVLDYDLYHEYSSIWTEDFTHPSNRKTVMTNTNKLSRFYSGCIGGKTGSTNEAGYCLAVGAKRNEMTLISVVLGADTTKNRFKIASDLLNYGFSNFEQFDLLNNNLLEFKTIKIEKQKVEVPLECEKNSTILVEKGKTPSFEIKYNLPSALKCCKKGDVIGKAEIYVDGILYETVNIITTEDVKELTFKDNINRVKDIFFD